MRVMGIVLVVLMLFCGMSVSEAAPDNWVHLFLDSNLCYDEANTKVFMDRADELIKTKIKQTLKDNTYEITYFLINKDTQDFKLIINERYDSKGNLSSRFQYDSPKWRDGTSISFIQEIIKRAN